MTINGGCRSGDTMVLNIGVCNRGAEAQGLEHAARRGVIGLYPPNYRSAWLFLSQLTQRQFQNAPAKTSASKLWSNGVVNRPVIGITIETYLPNCYGRKRLDDKYPR